MLVGTFMTSLNMPGFSLSLIKLPTESTSLGKQKFNAEGILELLDAPAQSSGWKWAASKAPNTAIFTEDADAPVKQQSDTAKDNQGPSRKSGGGM